MLSKYTVQKIAKGKDGKNHWIEITATARFWNEKYLGIESMEVTNTDICSVAMVQDWLSLIKEAKESAEQHFQSMTEKTKAVA